MRDVTMRWPVDEIGRYSVSPSTRPSTIAWPTLSDASTTARTPSANAGVATSASATAASTGTATTRVRADGRGRYGTGTPHRAISSVVSRRSTRSAHALSSA